MNLFHVLFSLFYKFFYLWIFNKSMIELQKEKLFNFRFIIYINFKDEKIMIFYKIYTRTRLFIFSKLFLKNMN